MLPCICYSSWNCKNPNHIKALTDMGFKGWRIFVPLGMLPAQISINSTSIQWRNYIINFVNNCPDGCWDWDNFTTNWWSGISNQRFKDCLNFCKANKWLPIFNLCASDETHGWIGLAPTSDKWAWLKKFTYEFALYLKNVYGFDRCDLEPINEPNEKGNVNDWYAPLVIAMSEGWKSACPSWKVHACGVDVTQQNYINACLENSQMLKVIDYISPHCLTINEWDRGLIEITYNKVSTKGKKLALLEMSPVSQSNDRPPLGYIPDRMNKLINRCDMYGIVLMIRNEAIGTSMDLDDIYMYPLNNPSGLYCTSGSKRDWITNFNKTYYIPYEVEDMELELNYVKSGTINEETRTVQEILKDSGYIITVTGKCDSTTVTAIKDFQTDYNLKIDGWVGKLTWDKLLSETASGAMRFAQLLTRKAVYK